MSEQKPSTTLATLTKFCVQVYFPSWFQIKSKHKLTDGPKICLICIKTNQNFFDLKVKSIVLKVIERNANFAQPEYILLGTLADSDESIRNAAVEKIVMHIKNRGAIATELIEEGSKNLAIRRFEMTQINCKLQSYRNMANIDAEKIAEPPLLQSLSLIEILNVRSAPLKVSHSCCNHAVKCHIKLAAETLSVTAEPAGLDGAH